MKPLREVMRVVYPARLAVRKPLQSCRSPLLKDKMRHVKVAGIYRIKNDRLAVDINPQIVTYGVKYQCIVFRLIIVSNQF